MYTVNKTVDENFYPFGVSAGDVQLPRVDDGSSPALLLSTPFQFFETSESTLYVSQPACREESLVLFCTLK